MTIKREDIETGKIDFSDITTGRRLPAVHPGDVLKTEFLEPLSLSVYQLAKDLKVQRSRPNEIVLGQRSLTADTALRLAVYFGTTPEYWINLQTQYDLDIANRQLRKKIEREVAPRAA
ncbi:MAG: HigA family addiction module antitoxin [Verrucomicrobiaceae bacterium]|uniref:HigA family addiction module antitoxin n=1 Tax=Aestuariivirga sp. TaxID=2650926 RepID=UPI00301A849A